jgi:hypothetical protein
MVCFTSEMAGVPLVIPWLQSCKQKTTIMLRMAALFLLRVFKSKLFSPLITNSAPPYGGDCFVLDRGAGGSRTRVQARRPYAFYMLILPCLSGAMRWQTTGPLLISCYFTVRAERPSGYP